jgi:hypothetical protein
MLRNSLLKLLFVVLSPLFVSISGCESDLSTARGEKVAQATRVFLQQISFDSAIVKWRGGPDVVWYGSKPDVLSQNVTANVEAGHKISKLEDLSADTVYYYAFQEVGPEADIMSFRTAPALGGVPADGNTHIWLLGDSGTATENQGGSYSHAGEAVDVMNGFLAYNKSQAGNEPLDMLLLLGDNAYLEGTDEQWQGAFFDIYTEIIKGVATWPTIGNHEMGTGAPFDICVYRRIPACESGPVLMNLGGISSSSDPNSYDSDGDGPDSTGLPYLNIFTLPSKGEMGGVPSGTEQYYSLNYGNVHVISLDSQLTNRDEAQRAIMRDWLVDDLSANELDWTIVIFHHPPYSKGSNHDSDREQNEIDMRVTFAPVFENYGVDVIYSGHSHSYERSWYLRGHYGMSDSFDISNNAFLDSHGKPALGQGSEPYRQGEAEGRSVYTVAGNAGKADKEKPCPEGMKMGCTLPNWLKHPAHRTFDKAVAEYKSNGIALKGSIVLDANKSTLTSRFVDEHGQVLDYFTITRD